MPLGKPIPIRLSDEKWAYYSALAQHDRVGLSTYIKRRLEQDDDLGEQIESLRREVGFAAQHVRANDAPSASSVTASDRGLLIEAVLLLRSVVGAEKLGMVHAELRRQGLPVWTPERSSEIAPDISRRNAG